MGPLSLIPAGLQTLAGIGQTLFSGEKKANKKLEKFANSYKPNESIMDLYNKALSRYDTNAYNSAGYRQQTNNINRNLVTGINASQTRRGGLSTISGLVQGANDASGRAVVQAEQQQAQQLGQLAQATGMKAAEDKVPFELKYNLLAAKAGQAARTKNMGLQNIFGGLSNASSMLGGGGEKKDPRRMYDDYLA
jgi:hypothetical protein